MCDPSQNRYKDQVPHRALAVTLKVSKIETAVKWQRLATGFETTLYINNSASSHDAFVCGILEARITLLEEK